MVLQETRQLYFARLSIMQNCQSLCQTAPILLLVLLTTEIFTCWILISPKFVPWFIIIPYVPICSIYFHIFSIYVPTDFSIWVWINTYENTIFRGLFTSINPSYFEVNYRGTRVLFHRFHFPPGEGCGGARRFRGFIQDQEDLGVIPRWCFWFLYDLYGEEWFI